VNLLMAVLEKRSGIQLSGCDAYVNITGGLKVVEPAIDLAIVLATVSSFWNRVLPPKMIAFGEVGLSGEVRAVSQAAQRVQEAEKLGFEICLLPKANLRDCSKAAGLTKGKMRVVAVETVQDALDYCKEN
jgi:DNA repair protein RadA/Sms